MDEMLTKTTKLAELTKIIDKLANSKIIIESEYVQFQKIISSVLERMTNEYNKNNSN